MCVNTYIQTSNAFGRLNALNLTPLLKPSDILTFSTLKHVPQTLNPET